MALVRVFLTIPMTPMQKACIQLRAHQLGQNPTNFARRVLLEATPNYDGTQDPDLGIMVRQRRRVS